MSPLCFILYSFLVKFQYCQEGALGHFYVAHLPHAFLAFFLLFEQLALTFFLSTDILSQQEASIKTDFTADYLTKMHDNVL